MKKLITLLLLALMFNCTLYLQGDFKDPEDIMNWIHKNIEYKANIYYRQYPIDTLNKQQGDCDDMTWLFAQMCADYLQILPQGVILKGKQSFGFHAMAIIDDDYYDCSQNLIFSEKQVEKDYEIIREYYYTEIPFMYAPLY